MNKSQNKELYTFKTFEKIDNDSKCYDLAWPVEVIECYANKVSDEELNSLALTVLRLLNENPSFTASKISNFVHVGEIIINDIIRELESKGFYNRTEKKLTEIGSNYLLGIKKIDFSDEEIFGNVFMSKIDGEIIPFFYEGKLPESLSYKDDNLVSLKYETNIHSKDIEDLKDRINHAYHEYKLIYKNSIHDEDEVDFRDPSEREIKSDMELKKARIELLNTERREILLKTRIIVKKYAPEVFIVESPFMNNETTWFNQSFNRYIEENILLDFQGKDVRISDWTKNVSSLFYVEFPELQSANFEQWATIHFPYLQLKTKDKMLEVLGKKLKEVFRLNNLYASGDINKRSVINEYATTIEQILNCYIMKTDRETVVKKFQNNINCEPKAKMLLSTYGIIEKPNYRPKVYGKIRGFYVDKDTKEKKEKIISSFKDDNECGRSITDKYYYLVVNEYFQKNSSFGKLLIERNKSVYIIENDRYTLIEALDCIQDFRNEYGSHSHGPNPHDMSESEFNKFKGLFEIVSNDLLKFYTLA